MLPYRRVRRMQRSRLSRLLKSVQRIGKYSLASALVALAGCLPPDNLISVSPDGRYLAVFYNQKGVQVGHDDPGRLMIIDLQTKNVRAFDDIENQPFWLDSVGDLIVYNAEHEEAPRVTILRDGQATHIDRAACPSFSDDGRYLVYSRTDDLNSQESKLSVRDLQDETTRDLDLPGLLAQISPDNKRLLFIAQDIPAAQTEAGADADLGWGLYVAAIDGADRKLITKIDSQTTGPYLCPRWIDAETLIYRTRNEQSPDDGELFLAKLNGTVEQLTDNELEDAHALPISGDRIVYIRKDAGTDGVYNNGEVFLANRVENKWEHKSLGVSAFALTVAGDQLFYVTVDRESETAELFQTSLNDPKASIDLDKLVREQVGNLPRSEKPGD